MVGCKGSGAALICCRELPPCPIAGQSSHMSRVIIPSEKVAEVFESSSDFAVSGMCQSCSFKMAFSPLAAAESRSDWARCEWEFCMKAVGEPEPLGNQGSKAH